MTPLRQPPVSPAEVARLSEEVRYSAIVSHGTEGLEACDPTSQALGDMYGSEEHVRHDDTVVQEFEIAFERLWAVALGVARRFFGPGLACSQRAEDIAQETLVRAFEHWERATRHGRVDAWVATTATNVCLEVARKARRRDDHIGRHPDLPVPDTEQSVDDADVLARALRRLTVRERDVVVWRHLLDCSEAETAAALGITVSQVKDAAHRGRRKLQASLGRATGALI